MIPINTMLTEPERIVSFATVAGFSTPILRIVETMMIPKAKDASASRVL